MRQFRDPSVWAVLAGLGVAACGNSGGEWQGTITDSAGVAIVSNTDDGLWGSGEEWAVAEELRIGTAAGEPEYQFGMISGMDVDAEGRIYVLDQQGAEVRVFSPDGQYISSMGKAGAGPGELGGTAGPLFVGRGDTVYVPDMSHQRVTRYTSDGAPAGSFPIPMAEGIPAKWMQTPEKEIVQQAMIMAMPGMQEVEPRNLLLRRGSDGTILDTITVMPASQTVDFSSGQPRFTIFAPEPMWAVDYTGRIVTGNNANYRLEVRNTKGELERVITKEYPKAPVTEGDRQEFRRAIMEAWEQAGMPPQAVEMMSQSIRFADHYPAYANIMGGPDGSIWTQGVQSPEDVQEAGRTFDMQDMGTPEWEVFDARGRYLGIVRMPPRFMPLLFEGDHVYGVLRDDLDIQYAARMKLDRGQEPVGE